MTSVLGLDVKQFSKYKRESKSTSHEMISDPNSSARYRRGKESEKALKFIHGGETGSFFGAWDYIACNAPKEHVTELFGSMTTWNLGERVRSSDFQYLLHCVIFHSKHEVLEDLWKQHTDKMAIC